MSVAEPSRGAREDPMEGWLGGFVRDPAFLAKYPYYAAVLARLSPVADPSIDAMAVSLHERRFYLHVNPEYFLKHPIFLRGILLHEVHHVVLGHLTNARLFDAAHPDLMEIAEECSANEHVEEPLPDPITWRAFEPLGLRAGQSTLERYERLVAARELGRAEPKPSLDPRKPTVRAPGGGDVGRYLDEHGWSPGGTSSRVPPGAGEHTRALVASAIEDVASDERLEKPAGKALLLAGREPGRILVELEGALGPAAARMDWRTALQMFVARVRAPRHTWARPSRRFPGRIGEIPGRAWVSRAVERPRLLVAIDTSMSMSDRELLEIARQLVPLSEHASLIVAECDAEVQRTYPFEGTLPRVKGRGGTDLRPAFEPSLLRAHAVCGVIFFTDGVGPYPERAPSVPTLWVLTKDARFACPFGDRTRLEV